jgi:Zn-dependent protease
MVRSLRIGRILGVDVNVHPTFGIVLLWAIWRWGFGPERGAWQLVLGLVLVLLLLASILVHELGHCLMATNCGIRVLDITLWPFGGVARIEQAPSQPRTEFLIAFAGPATNLAVVVALLPVLLLIGVTAGFDTVIPAGDPLKRLSMTSMLGYLAITNLLVMLFNLIPAFPFDGGRMLRASLVPGLGRERATRIAVLLGFAIAVVFVVLGAWERSLLLVILGFFVIFAAWAEARAERVQAVMQRLTVGQYALWDMGGIGPDEQLTFALRGGPRDMAVTEGGQVVGMLWRSQLLDSIANGMGGRRVAEVMDQGFWAADVNDSVFDVQLQMSRSNRWAVPVLESGRYRGIFTADRFVSLYRQIARGGGGISLPREWREAISETFSSWTGTRRH